MGTDLDPACSSLGSGEASGCSQTDLTVSVESRSSNSFTTEIGSVKFVLHYLSQLVEEDR